VEGSSHAKNQFDLFSRFDRTPICDRWTQTDTDTDPWLVPQVHSIARYAVERARRVDRRKCDQQSSTVDSRDDPRAVAKLFKSGVWDTVPEESFLVSEESRISLRHSTRQVVKAPCKLNQPDPFDLRQ